MQSTKQITIVSGLPRSGTSVMMQMLAAGGLAPLADEVRKADVDNPRGYFEFERAKQIKTDSAWLTDAEGRVVKMVHLLLLDLPVRAGTAYAIVFMRRDLQEVIQSQGVMLQRLGKASAGLPAAQLQQVYLQQIERVKAFVASRADMRLLEVGYAEVVGDPTATAEKVAAFVGAGLDARAMVAAVDPSLYRNRRR